MKASALGVGPEARPHGRRATAVVALSLLAAALLALRAASESQRDTILASVRVQYVVIAVVAAVLAAAAAWAASRSESLTAKLLGGALFLELLLSWLEVRVPLVVALPLLVALAVVLVPMLRREGEPGVDYSQGRTTVAVTSVALMVPIGLFYFSVGMLVPEYAVPVAWLIWIVLFLGTLWLAVRRSWWAAAGPTLAVMIWVGGLLAGEVFLGWTA